MTFRIVCYIIEIVSMIGIITALIVVTVINKKADNKRKRIVKRIKEVISLDDKECLKKDAPVPVTVNIVMRNATAEENEGINNYIKSISEPLYTKNDMIERLEKVKKEMHDMLESDVVQGDHWCALIKNKAHLFISVVEKNIDELKESNNESAN